MKDEDLDYLREHLLAAKLVPHTWHGEDRNIAAFSSKNTLVEWYGQAPGVDGEPYRDRGFYCRELAMLSRTIQPKTIVEFGTSLGIGTCLLHWMNPKARIVTVDVNDKTFLPGDKIVPIGYLARHQRIPCEFVLGRSWEYQSPQDVGLCFIDGDHSYKSVMVDSARAWWNRRHVGTKHDPARWAIAWHDHNDRHPGVVQAVSEFCLLVGFKLQSRPDSDTVWIEGGEQ